MAPSGGKYEKASASEGWVTTINPLIIETAKSCTGPRLLAKAPNVAINVNQKRGGERGNE